MLLMSLDKVAVEGNIRPPMGTRPGTDAPPVPGEIWNTVRAVRT